MDTKTKIICEEVLRIAQNGNCTDYDEIASLADLSMGFPSDRQRIDDILVVISRREHRNGRPLLSAVVIREDTGMPDAGFFKLAKELGLYAGGRKREYWKEELRRVHNYWEN